MSLQPDLPLLVATIQAARTDARVVAAFGPRPVAVWESEPSRAPGFTGETGYPFVEIPAIQVTGGERIDNGVCIYDPKEAFVTVSVFSRIRSDGTGGKPESMAISEALALALIDGLQLALGSGWRVTLGDLPSSRHFTESDGLTAHSSMTFRYQIEPSED